MWASVLQLGVGQTHLYRLHRTPGAKAVFKKGLPSSSAIIRRFRARQGNNIHFRVSEVLL